MPPKVKFQKEEIVLAAAEIVRERGIDALTARELAAKLNVSTRPIFTYFDTLEELRKEVYHYAVELYRECIRKGLSEPIPALGVGMHYIRFAKEEPQLYRYLFLSPPAGVSGGAMEALRTSQEMVRESVMTIYHMDAVTADRFFRDLWLVAYSFTTLIVTNACPYSDDEISALFTEFSLSICKAYKEIPGLGEGKYDKDAIFRELIKK